MSMLTPPAFLQAGTYTAALDRQYGTNHHYQPKGGDPSRCRTGVLPAPDAWSGQVSVSGLNVSVSPFRCVIENNNASGAGDYKGTSLTTETRTMAAASTTQNRIDVIGARVRDAFYAGSDSDIDVVIIQGTPAAGTPAVPTLPNGFMPMFNLLLNANATTPTVTDVRVRTTVLGGMYVPFTSQIAAAGVYPGETSYLPASGIMPLRQRVWGADGQWHGLTPFTFDMGSWVISSSTADRLIAQATIPDPGYPYRIFWSGYVASGFDGNNGWVFTLRQGLLNSGTLVGGQGMWETRDPDNNFTGSNSIAMTSRTQFDLTGGQTFGMWAQRKFGAATQGMSVAGGSVCGMVIPV